MALVQSQRAHDVCRAAGLRRGLSGEHADWFAQSLVQTSLAGIDTHGLRLLPLYLREIDEGRSNAKPVIRVANSAGATLVLDADDAPGTVAGTHAAHTVCQLATRYGVGAVSVANSNHFGAASVYGSLIASNGMVGVVTTSAAARVSAFNGRLPFFGTNPLCFSAPTQTEQPFVFDMVPRQD